MLKLYSWPQWRSTKEQLFTEVLQVATCPSRVVAISWYDVGTRESAHLTLAPASLHDGTTVTLAGTQGAKEDRVIWFKSLWVFVLKLYCSLADKSGKLKNTCLDLLWRASKAAALIRGSCYYDAVVHAAVNILEYTWSGGTVTGNNRVVITFSCDHIDWRPCSHLPFN